MGGLSPHIDIGGADIAGADISGAAAAGGAAAAATNAVVLHAKDGSTPIPTAGGSGAGAGAGGAAVGAPSGDEKEEEGREVGFLAAPRAEGLTGDDFQCNICWELLARPVTLVCGHTACESCMAKYLRAQAQAQAQIGNFRANCISCPAGEITRAFEPDLVVVVVIILEQQIFVCSFASNALDLLERYEFRDRQTDKRYTERERDDRWTGSRPFQHFVPTRVWLLNGPAVRCRTFFVLPSSPQGVSA